MRARIYYGMSGTFKSTTLEVDADDLFFPEIIKSNIKLWKSYEKLFPAVYQSSNLNYAVLHLLGLEQSNRELPNLLIERGVTDSLCYERVFKGNNQVSKEMIDAVVMKELELLSKYEVEKILLIQKDREFIENVVLKEPSRAAWFKGVDDYLYQQEKYVGFTKAHNEIASEIIIDSAEDYVKNVLHLDFQAA